MNEKLQNVQIANWVQSRSFEDINPEIIDQLKRHLLDSLGSFIFSIDHATPQKLFNQLRILGEGGKCKAPLLDNISYDRAAQLFTALIRYPDFMDNYLAKEATCHPSDNIGSLLAASQYKKTNGKDFLTAMAIAYQLQCRLCEEIPVMKKGSDHTLLLAYSIAASVSKLLGLNVEQTAHALAIAGCSVSPLVTSRASYTFEWKGFASSMDALECMNIVFLAQQGLTGPLELFEGPKGFKEIFDMNLDYDWKKETFELIPKCILKKYNAEVHSQSAIDAIIELKSQNSFDINDIEKINVTTFLTAYHIIGSGAYGNRKEVGTKEQADHSFFYLIAVALLDGDVYPEQFDPERIKKSDVQELLQKVFVDTSIPMHKPVEVAGILDPYTKAYPEKMKTKVEIVLKGQKNLVCEKDDYPGFHTIPFTWAQVIQKFKRLTGSVINDEEKDKIISVVQDIENRSLSELMELICVE